MNATASAATSFAYFAGGCFWCVESDLSKLPKVLNVESGYMGGTNENPTYENAHHHGHREVVRVTYDPAETTFRELVIQFFKTHDPTDVRGSFADKGHQYTSAIYTTTSEEAATAREVIERLDTSGIYEKPIATEVLPASIFWPAEVYHQDYAKKNPEHYERYREGSGRAAFVAEHAKKINELFLSEVEPLSQQAASPELSHLTDLQKHVTQEGGTEAPFANEYWDNHEEGIYVDIVTGEPLFSSTDKYDSGTGWPSFTKPLSGNAVACQVDLSAGMERTEVKGSNSGSHLGHVFDDGPGPEGKRYCMNSAALRFVPKAKMAEEGYSKYLDLFARNEREA